MDPRSVLPGSAQILAPPTMPGAMMPQASPLASLGLDGAGDPFLAQLFVNAPPPAPVSAQPRKKDRTGYLPKPSISLVTQTAESAKRRFAHVIQRMSRDLAIYRQHSAGIPNHWDINLDPIFVSAALSNMLNKLVNISAEGDLTFEVPFYGDPEEEASQAVEDYCYDCRRKHERIAARSGTGDLAWEEHFYNYLHGRIVARVLPDPKDDDFPYQITLLDPATVFPLSGGGKVGWERVVHRYEANLIDVLETFAKNDPKKRKKILRDLGYDDDRETWDIDLDDSHEVIDYWDTWNRVAIYRNVVILDEEHALGRCPFVYTMARGEPRAVSTPEGTYHMLRDEWQSIGYNVGRDVDQAEKGVSVFHHIVRSHQLREAVFAIYLAEIEKSEDPPTITYTMPQFAGKEQPPLDSRRGGRTTRWKNVQEVQGFPTSPRPSDASPFLAQVSNDIGAAGLADPAYGIQEQSNISGFATNALIGASKEVMRPYVRNYETFQSLVYELKLYYLREFILPSRPVSVPHRGEYGAGSYRTELTSSMLDMVGIEVMAHVSGITQQSMMQIVQTARAAVDGGIWSQKEGMKYAEVKNPTRMWNDIMAERAMQRPEMQDMFLIPQGFIERGAPNLAQIWLQAVVQPKLGQMQAQMGGPPGFGGDMGASLPEQGVQASPGGPMPGQGRS